MHYQDILVLRWINGWSNDWAPFYDFLSEATKMRWVQVVLIILILCFLFKGGAARVVTLLSLGAIVLANFICDLFKNHMPLGRPCVELANVVNHGVGFLQSPGTFSAHAANMAALATVVTYFYGRWGLIPILLAFFTGVSRIYVGVHYPSQVLYGWFCGGLVAFGIVNVYRHFDAKKRPEAE
jgi:undecaprenyl-diphosphatase